MPTPRTKPRKKTKEESDISLTNLTNKTIYKSWCIKSKKELIKTAKNNLNKRMIKFLSVTQSSNIKLNQFTISNTEISKMINGCCNTISSWNGVEIKFCKQQKTTYKQYKITATNWFNRNKAKIFANHFFFPIIFNHLLNFIRELEMNGNDQNKMSIFVDTLLLIFAEDINFARTKSQALIPHQSLIQPNSFKSQCKHFIEFYGVEWNQKDIIPAKIKRIYQKDKNRSKKIYDTFITSLNELKQLLTSRNLSLFKFYSLNNNNKINKSNNIKIKNNENNKDSLTANNINNFGRNEHVQNVYNSQNTNIIDNLLPLQTQVTQQRQININLNPQMFLPNIPTMLPTFANNFTTINSDGNNWLNQFNLNGNQLNQFVLLPIAVGNNFNNQNGVMLPCEVVPSILIHPYLLTPNI